MENKFDYKSFAKDLKNQVKNIMPSDLNAEAQLYVEDKIYKNVIKLAENFETEKLGLIFDNEKYVFACQIVAEWTFHKSVDLFRSSVPKKYYDPILETIYNVIYKTLKNLLTKNVSSDYILNKLEVDVQLEYKKCIKDLEAQNIINEEEMNKSLTQYNLALLVEQGYDNDNCNSDANTSESHLISQKDDINVSNNGISHFAILNNKKTWILSLILFLICLFVKYYFKYKLL